MKEDSQENLVHVSLLKIISRKFQEVPRSTRLMNIQAHEHTTTSTVILPPKVWERFVDDIYSILKCTHVENFHHISNLHQNIKFTMEEESNGKLAFLDTLLDWNNRKVSVLVYRKPSHTDLLETVTRRCYIKRCS